MAMPQTCRWWASLALLVVVALLVVAGCAAPPPPAVESDAVVYTGARLIVGDESAPIDNAAIVVEDGSFTLVGPASAIQVPQGAEQVNLAGKTVMPAIIDAHGHLGYRRGADFRLET